MPDHCSGEMLNAMLEAWIESGHAEDCLNLYDGIMLTYYMAKHHPEYLQAMIVENETAMQEEIRGDCPLWLDGEIAEFCEAFVRTQPLNLRYVPND